VYEPAKHRAVKNETAKNGAAQYEEANHAAAKNEKV
jgi:hypothetical protein